jgi:hypothetical protein
MARSILRAEVHDSAGNVQANSPVSVYEADGITLLAQAMYAVAVGGTALLNPVSTDYLGRLTLYAATPQGVILRTSANVPFISEFRPDPTSLVLLTNGAIITPTMSSPIVSNYLDLTEQGSAAAVPGAGVLRVSARSGDFAAAIGNGASEVAFVDSRTPLVDNPFINAGFRLWTRGTSFAAIANGSYWADRWLYTTAGSTAVHTVSRSTDVPAVSALYPHQNYSGFVACTTADAAVAAGDVVAVGQRIEGFYWEPLAGRVFTLSFWVKAKKAGIHCVSFRNSVSDRSYVAEYTINTIDTWEYKRVTVTASPSAGTWDYTTGIGLIVSWALMAGSTFQTTAGAWQTGNFLATASQVNDCDSTANEFRLAMVRLDVGEYDRPWLSRPIGVERALCREYAQVIQALGAVYSFGSGGNTTTTVADITIPFPPMRAAPTVTFRTAASDFQVYAAGVNTACTSFAVVSNRIGTDRLLAQATVASGLTIGQAAQLLAVNANASILLTAEI